MNKMLFTFNMVLWVEGPPFVDSCGIFWTKLCDSRLISVIHTYLVSLLPALFRNKVSSNAPNAA